MEGSLKVSKSRPWLICVLCCLIFLFSNGAVSSSFSTTLMYIRDEFALSEAQASMVTSMRSLTASFCLAILLFGYSKLSVKAVIIVALGAAVAGFLVFAYAASYPMLLVGSLLLGICYGFAGVGVITPVVRSWFVKHRALALGLVTASTGFANVIFPQIIRLLVNGASLRVNFIVTAIMFAAIAVVAIIFLKDDPIKAGYYPLGGETLTETASDGGAQKEYVESSEYAPDWRCHALMFVFIFCVSGFNYSAWSNFTLLFTGAGWARDTVTYFMSICGFLLMVTKSGYGAISDKFSVRKSGWVFFLACFIAMVMCGLFSGVQNLAVMGVIFVIYCIGGIFSGVSLGIYAMEFSNAKNTKYLSAVYVLVFNICNLVTGNIVGAIAEAYGDYRPAYLVLAGFVVVGFICVNLAYKISMNNRKKLDAAAKEAARQ